MIRLTCRQCKGTGIIPNIAYEMCRTMQSPEAKRHFYFDYDDVPDEVNPDGCAVHEQTVPCPRCGGHGFLEFDEEEWDLAVVPEEDEEG